MRRDKISLYAFMTTCVIVLVLLLGVGVNAATNFSTHFQKEFNQDYTVPTLDGINNYLSDYGYSISSSFYNSLYFANSSTSFNYDFDDINLSDPIVFNEYTGVSLSFDSVSNIFFTGTNNMTILGSSSEIIYAYTGSGTSFSYISKNSFTGGNITLTSSSSFNSTGTATSQYNSAGYYYVNQNIQNKVNFNIPIYVKFDSSGAVTSLSSSDIVSILDGDIPENVYNININYDSYYDKNSPDFGKDPKAEAIKEHNTLYDGSIMYLVSQSMNSGQFYIYPNLDNYQKENKSDFHLKLVVSAVYRAQYNTAGRFHAYTSNNIKLLNLYDFSTSPKDFSDSRTYSFPLTDMNNGYFKLELSDINDGLNLYNMADGLSNAYSSYKKPFYNTVGAISFSGIGFDAEEVYDSEYDVIASAINYHFDLYMNEISEPLLVFDYDFLTGNGTLNYSNLTSAEDLYNVFDDIIPSGNNFDNNPITNYPDTINNYYPSGSSGTSQVGQGGQGGQGGSGGSATIGDNNQLVNVTTGGISDETANRLVDNFIPSTIGSNGGLSERLQNAVNTNGYLNFMKSTLAFIPPEFFDELFIYFKACLTILVGAFVFSVITRLL